jgi:hypothetical protein
MLIIGTVDMAVVQFLARGLPNLLDSNVEMQGDAGQRMIGIDDNIIHIHAYHRDHPRTRFIHGLKLHTDLNVLIGVESRTRELLHQILVSGAIGLFGWNDGVDLITHRLAFERRFQAGNDVADSMDVGEGASAVRGVQFSTLRVGKGVIYGFDLVFGDLHRKSFLSKPVFGAVYAFMPGRPTHTLIHGRHYVHDMKQRDDEQKISLLMTEAEQGDARAQRLLALRYWRGRGVMQSDELAVQWMKKAAAQKSALAERDLAGFYRQGIGVERDPAEALRLYRLAAQQGDPIARRFIREMLEIDRPK